MSTVLGIVLALIVIVSIVVVMRFAGPMNTKKKTAGYVAQFRNRPPIGSPAQVLLDRGARAVQGIRNRVADTPGFYGLLTDADAVIEKLSADATRVTVLNRAESKEQALAHSTTRHERSSTSTALSATAQMPHSEKDQALARMRAASVELERIRDEVSALIVGEPGIDDSVAIEAGSVELRALGERMRGVRASYARKP